jgi:hypothetical protein
MDPFVIIKNYRQQRQALYEESPLPRSFLKEIDPNTLPTRNLQPKISRVYREEDK